MARFNQTKDHGEIRRWAHQRGARPAFLRGANVELHLDFGEPGQRQAFKEVDWDRWFAVFDSVDLVFQYESDPSSTWYQLVSREAVS